jgi:EpsI family protein
MRSRFWVGYAGMIVLLSSTIFASYAASKRHPESLQRPLATINREIAGWTLSAVEEARLSASSSLARTYVKGDDQLELLIAYHNSHKGAVNAHSPKNCLPGDGWEIWKSSTPFITFNGRPVAVNEYHIYRMGSRMTVLHWYQSRGRVTANEYLTKLMQVRDGLLDGRTSESFVRVVLPDRPELLSEGLQFTQGVMQQLQLCFRP